MAHLLLGGLPSDIASQLLQLLELARPGAQLLAQLATLGLLGQLCRDLLALLLQLAQLALPRLSQVLAQLTGLPKPLTQLLIGLLARGAGVRQMLLNLNKRCLRLLPGGMLGLQLAGRLTGEQLFKLRLRVSQSSRCDQRRA